MRETPPIDRPVPPSDGLARKGPPNERGLIDRILDTPHLALVVPRLPPEMLHKVIQTCGLEDCGDLVAMATPEQLRRVFDLDVWRATQPGFDEQLDADRFGVWLEVLMECGKHVAAQKIVGIDVDLVIAGLAQHVRVFDRAAVSPAVSSDGEEEIERRLRDGIACEVGGYVVEARRTDVWDTIVGVLSLLDVEHPDYFHQVMRGCRTLSDAGFEIDGLHDLLDAAEQDMFDLAVDRERRREQRGYVTPEQARAFLHAARLIQLTHPAAPSSDPIALAHLRAIEWTPPADATASSSSHLLPAAAESSNRSIDGPDPIVEVVDLLREAGVLPEQPRALLEGRHADGPQHARLETHLQFTFDRDPVVYSRRMEELAYLANTLRAGCSVQARPFTEREASDAALAICNLGLENWPRHWLADQSPGSSGVERGATLPENFLVDHALVGVFQVGWKTLHDVCLHAAARLIEVLTELSCDDREIQSGLDSLRISMTRHSQSGTPWAAREALDVIAILDMPAWVALLGLIDECPVMHAAIDASRRPGTRTISPSAFTFISANSQVASVREFLQSLPEVLGG